MSSSLYDEIIKLDTATRLQLAQVILDSVAGEVSDPVTDDQRTELRARLAQHHEHPEEETVSLADIKVKLGCRKLTWRGRYHD